MAATELESNSSSVMRLYHFLSANFALDDIDKRRIKISEIDQLNDPFELWCVPQDDQRLREALRGFKKEMGERYGMLCFRTGGQDANPMMASDAQPSGFEGGVFDLLFSSWSCGAPRVGACGLRGSSEGVPKEYRQSRKLNHGAPS